MARPRKDLHKELKRVMKSLGLDGNVYYVAPSNNHMEYPCILYSLARQNVRYANNGRYLIFNQYDLTVIDRDEDSPIVNALCEHFSYCSSDRNYVSDNLHHTTLILYF